MTNTTKNNMKTYNLNMTISAKEDISQDEILDKLVEFAETNDYLVGGGLQELDENDSDDKNTWTFEEILDACYPTLGRGGDWSQIAIRLKEQKK